MKNIAIIIDGLTGGGAEKVMLCLSKTLLGMGHKVSLLSLGGQCDYRVPEGLRLDVLFSGKASNVDCFWRIKSSVAKLESWFDKQQESLGKFDLVLSNLDKSSNLLSKIRRTNIDPQSIFYIIHNSVEQELQRQKKLGPLAYLYLKKAKKNLSGKNLICVSKGLEHEIRQGSTINPASIGSIYNPVDFDEILKQADVNNENIPHTPYLIHVGRFAKQKRHDVLLEAFKHVDSRYKLVLLCNKRERVRKLVKKYGIEDRVILPGFQRDPYNWIKRAEALLLTSDYEGLSMVLLEALAVGTKVVSTNCPHGPSEILTGDLARYLVPVGDSAAMLLAINEVLSADLMCQNAPILKQVEATVVAEQYLALCFEKTPKQSDAC